MNNKDIYVGQTSTGPYSRFNCAAACVAMAGKLQGLHMPPVNELRANNRSLMMWKHSDIYDTLFKHNVSFSAITPQTTHSVIKDILKDHVMIVNLNMANIDTGRHINKSYTTWLPWWYHYLVITDISEEEKLYKLTVLDPYDDATQSGRIFEGYHLMESVRMRGADIILINK